MKVEFMLFCLGCVALGHVIAHCMKRLHRRRHKIDDTFTGLGFSVEMDCRGCGKINRVPAQRLRDRAVCGCCKVRLMPRKKVAVCHVTVMDGSLRSELDKVWDDEDLLWQALADHVLLKTKKSAEDRDPRLRLVN